MKKIKKKMDRISSVILVFLVFAASINVPILANSQEDTNTVENDVIDEVIDNDDIDEVIDNDRLGEVSTTAISSNRDEGISSVQTVIPDYNFASAVYDALFSANHLGTEGQSVKDVLSSFQGKIEANGYVKISEYITYLIKFEPALSKVEVIEMQFFSQEEAQAFLDSFYDTDEVKYLQKKITVQMLQTEDRKPDSELVHSIDGILWLRNAAEIDLKRNAISDFMPLSKEAIEKAMGELTSSVPESYKKWFGGIKRNIMIDISGNPVEVYAYENGGRAIINVFKGHAANKDDKNPIILLKPHGRVPNWNQTIDIQIPRLEAEGEQVDLIYGTEQTGIIMPDDTGAKLVSEKSTNKIFHTNGIARSGMIFSSVLADSSRGLKFWVVIENSQNFEPSFNASTPCFSFDQKIRVYMEVNPDVLEISSTTIIMNNTLNGTNTPVADTKFQLYKASLVNGDYVKGEPYKDAHGKDVICITDISGQFTFTSTLPEGDYCFVKIETGSVSIPNDENNYGFSVVSGGSIAITGGEQVITPSDTQVSVSAATGSTFIDRYSPNVKVKVEGVQEKLVDRVIITYMDRETQAIKTEEVATVKAATDWINSNKGDKGNVGVIDGTVTLKAFINQEFHFESESSSGTQNPEKPLEPSEPDKPLEPSKPVEPDKPLEPSEPVEPDKPIEPSKPIEPVKPNQNLPETGDTSNTMLYISLMTLSVCVVGFILKKKNALSE